jgi:hypothetical protein
LGRAVDLVGEQDVGEHRALHELERLAPGGAVVLDDLGAGDVAGHQVRGELDPAEFQVEDVRERLDEKGLRQPRHTHQQAVAAGEHRDQDVLDHLLLPHDDPGDLLLDRFDAGLEAGDGFGVAPRGRCRLFGHVGHLKV